MVSSRSTVPPPSGRAEPRLTRHESSCGPEGKGRSLDDGFQLSGLGANALFIQFNKRLLSAYCVPDLCWAPSSHAASLASGGRGRVPSSHAGISPREEAAFPHRAPFNQKGAVETERERPVTHTTRALGKDMRTLGNSQESRMTWQDMKTLPPPEGSGDSQGCAACPCEWLRPAFQQLPLRTGWFSSPPGRRMWMRHLGHPCEHC